MNYSRILVTGAAGGLGLEVTELLLEQGAAVVAVGHEPASLDKLRNTFSEWAEKITITHAELTDPASVAELFAALGEAPLDGLVHTVGAYFGGQSIDQTPVEQWMRLVDLNLHTTFLMLRAAAAKMVAQQTPAAIVCVGSMLARSGAAQHAAYAASKAAVHSLVQSAAADLAGRLIRVNAVLPTTIATPANLQAMPGEDHTQWVTPREVAQLVHFLLSPKASRITGACIEIAGKSYQPG